MTRTLSFAHRSRLPVSADAALAWHGRPGALERLSPPWTPLQILEREGGIEPGGRVLLRMKTLGVWRRFEAVHREFGPGVGYCDEQRSGPFAVWRHRHSFEAEGDDACILEDEVEYAPPFGALGRALVGGYVQRRLERTFRYRHRVCAGDLRAHRESGLKAPIRVLVTGSSGLLGSTLVPFLRTGGHSVARLTHTPQAGFRFWDPTRGRVHRRVLEGFDAVVHLAGESVESGRWSDKKRRRIRESRVAGTRALAETLARCHRPPRVLVTASAVGIYGDRGPEPLREDSAAGEGFFADVCREAEEAAATAANGGIRVVQLRFGTILSPGGGALARILPPCRWGLGGRIGGGAQYVSWISVDDAAGVVLHAIARDELDGPVNAVSPHAVTQREFVFDLTEVLERPALLPLPASAARLVFGGMAREVLLASQRVVPERLLESGYSFRHPGLEEAFRHLLGRDSA